MSCNCQNNCSCSSSGVELFNVHNGTNAPTIVGINFNPDNSLKFTFSDGNVLNTATGVTFNNNLTSYVLFNDSTSGNDFTDIVVPANTLMEDGDKVKVSLLTTLEINTPNNNFKVTIGGTTFSIVNNTDDLNFLGVLNLDLQFIYDGIDEIICIGSYSLNSVGYTAYQGTIYFEFSPLDLTSDLTITLGQTNSILAIANAEIIKND